MFVCRRHLLLFIFASLLSGLSAQDLEKVPPVLTKSLVKDTATSFILNTMDFHSFMNFGHARYSNTVQIIDADEPWPPRWFSSLPVFDNDSINRADDLRGARRTNVMNDARFQNGFFTFYKERSETIHDEKRAEVAGYIICNKNLESIDTFGGVLKMETDLHDFRINSNKQKLVMLKLDTVLDLSKSSGKPTDTQVAATINIIAVLDSNNRIIFSWNPVLALGPNAFDYRSKTILTYAHSQKNNIDWSHGTSLSWDFDGNILYSFRFIGLGKISVKDGSLIWHLDWNKIPLIHKTDTLEFYAPHDFERLSDNATTTVYSVFSNGTQQHPVSYVLQFSVNKADISIHTVRKVRPEKKIFSPGWGNYEQDEKGNYLLNYGQYPKDTTQARHVFMEYRNKNNAINGKYELPAVVYAYKVHFIKNDCPPRPEILYREGLLASGDFKDFVWYKLSGPNHTTMKVVGRAAYMVPPGPGYYCVAGRYGLGYSVSKQLYFDRP